MHNRLFFSLFSLVALVGLSDGAYAGGKLVDYVDPKIGSGGHGHVFVGANVPFGMVQLGPTSITQAWDWTSGYHDSDSTVIGFSHTHLSGTGVGDLFDITFMPVIGEVTYSRGRHDDQGSGMWSYADRSKEIAKAGYYSIPLTRYGILAEMTATNRTGLHRYTFPATDSAAIVIDLQNGGCWDRPTYTEMTPEGNNRIVGVRKSTGWADNQEVYFVAEFSEPFSDFSLHGNENRFGRLSFPAMDDGHQIIVKVGISPTSVEAAKANLEAEALGLTFDMAVEKASDAWENELKKVRISSNDKDELTKFYTSMYHLLMLPATFSDHGATPAYTILSLWDTYRTQMPLLTILDPQRSGEIVTSMLDIHDKQGRLPVWHLWGCETDCMVGNPGIIVVADAVAKDLPGIDKSRAMKAMIETSMDTARGGGIRQQYGFIPIDLKGEAIAWDMEYAIADGAIANAAKAIGNDTIYDNYSARSKSYRNYFDPETHFMRGKDTKGGWRTPFDPRNASHREDDYCEGNAWQYTWLAPQDVEGLVELFGGKEKMVAKLDSLFTVPSEIIGEDASPDISGLIGQYAHGNEPSHHVIYLYTMLGNRAKAIPLITQVMDELYTTEPDGLSGNEDCGQMSAWYVMSALGFYPVEPASARYWIGIPRYDETVIELEGGKEFKVIRGSRSDGIIYLNGRKLDREYIDHKEIMGGGVLEIN
ncbi:MAG: GH92 family glycosyl hydrolase [Paramuribaculum sp.]|nr:GH92 family glycosyl hydrolase [Paramuribaculum sp.]